MYLPEYRSTFTGIAAAAGKLGAIVGIWVFEVLAEEWGVPPVMMLVATISVGGALISHHCIHDSLWETQQRQMAETASAAARSFAAAQVAVQGRDQEAATAPAPAAQGARGAVAGRGAEVANPIGLSAGVPHPS